MMANNYYYINIIIKTRSLLVQRPLEVNFTNEKVIVMSVG